MNTKLEVQDIVKMFNKKTILNKINFIVKDGEFLSILGPSGCGKTTILRILIGLLEPTSGLVLKEGKDITKIAPAKRGMGIVFQNYALFQNMTVLENVEYALQFHPELKERKHKIAMNLLEQMGLSEHMTLKPHKLSGGQQQRVAIARTLALNPDMILFDEPMSALDVANRITLREELKRIQKQFGTTMIYITHDQEEAFAMSDRIMVMNDGKIEQLDTPENMIKKPASPYIENFVIHNLKAKLHSLQKYMGSEL